MKNPFFRILISIFLVLLAGFILPSIVIVASGLIDDIKSYPFLESIFMFLFSVLIAWAISKGNLRDYGFRWSWDFPKKILLIGLALGFLSSFVDTVILKTSTANTPWENWTFMDSVINTWFFASIAEEVLIRGLVQSYLAPLKHLKVQLFGYQLSLPVIVGAVIFSLIHLVLLILGVDIYLVIVILVMAFFIGLIAGFYREKSGSLVPAILVHACANIGSSLLMLFCNYSA